MEILGFILLGLIGVAVAVYLFYLLRALIVIMVILLALYLVFFKDNLLGASIIVGGWYVLNSAVDKIVGSWDETQEKTAPKKSKTSFSPSKSAAKADSSRVNWNYILMWMIPLFWPFLIFRTFFRDKQAGKQDAYDYEQHLRSNGK